MKVSVVIPVYNKAPFLEEAIGSILTGSFTDLEVIAVDDKSSDDSLAILRTITDPRVRVIALPENLGPAGAANAAHDAAQGEYIVRMDADDIAVPDRIAAQVAFMDANPEVGASSGHIQLFGDDENIWRFPLSDTECRAQLLFAPPVSQNTSILRRSVLEKHGIRFDPAWPRIGEDWLFWLRLAPHTRMANLDRVLLHYRRGPQNLGHGRDKAADHVVLQEAVFKAMGFPCSKADIDLLVMGLAIFGHTAPTGSNIQELRQLYDRILTHNAQHGPLPQAALKQRVEQQWDRLFYFLPRFGNGAAWGHLRAGGRWPIAQLTYWGKYNINALLGRNPKA